MRRFVTILLLMAFGVTAVAAADLNAADAKRVRAVIQAQLAAFEVDDAARAFTFATPKLREQFGSAETFMQIVRARYPVVYRHASVAFLKPEREEGSVTQAVHFTDANGGLWLALYLMEQQGDGSWRISACQVVPAEGKAA